MLPIASSLTWEDRLECDWLMVYMDMFAVARLGTVCLVFTLARLP